MNKSTKLPPRKNGESEAFMMWKEMRKLNRRKRRAITFVELKAAMDKKRDHRVCDKSLSVYLSMFATGKDFAKGVILWDRVSRGKYVAREV